ncbi:MAG: ABC transporter ATP-binding protein [Gemmatimonadales bacterium]|nr:MAG: ABC transporter ATP-binding protein [Gemmatimonadales bacterium]
MNPLLSVRELTVGFETPKGPVRVVDGVSLELAEGETLGLVGESGSGKSTLALSLGRLLDEPPAFIDPGSRIEYAGVNLLALDPERLRTYRGKAIAWIFQDPASSLDPVIKVGHQIAEAVRAHSDVGRKAAWNRAVELLALVGLNDPRDAAHCYPHQLSGGMRQRVAIAAALAGEPKLLVADEPTTALDVTLQAQILALLGDLRERLGMALLLITHDLGVVADIADRVAVMYAGRLVEEGGKEQVLKQPAHPYTEALLRATPRLHRTGPRLPAIPGAAPDPTSWPSGCRFHPRCRYAWDRCSSEEPSQLSGETGRWVRCWLATEPQRRRG